jgi:hypothetical protein
MNGWFSFSVRNHQGLSNFGWSYFRSGGSRLKGCDVLTTTCLQKNFFFASEEDIAIFQIPRVLILSHLWWGRMHLLLGVHHTLVWNSGFATQSRVVVANTIVGLTEGKVVLEEVKHS